MSTLDSLGLALGLSFASGLNLYATVAAAGVLHRLGVVQLPESFQVLADPAVMTIAVALFLVEFVADKVPLVDSAWDVVHTFIRPPAAALLAWGAFGGLDEAWKVAAALLAGSVALSAHGAKASARAAVNTSPEPFSNWVLSLTEDAVAVILTWVALEHPVLAAVVVVILVALAVAVVVKLFRFVRAAWRRVATGAAAPPEMPRPAA
jgi:hypothetical protein